MPQILPSDAPYPKAVLGWDGTAFRVFAVDAAGHIQADVVTSGLPAGAATAAKQDTQITALQLIDDLRKALYSVGTDGLIVYPGYTGAMPTPILTDASLHAQADIVSSALPTGAATAANQATLLGKVKDQVFSYKGQLLDVVVNTNADAGFNALQSGAVPSGEIWVLTHSTCWNRDSSTSIIYLAVRHAATVYYLRNYSLPGVGYQVVWDGQVICVEGDQVEAQLEGCAAGDRIYLHYFGYKMTV